MASDARPASPTPRPDGVDLEEVPEGPVITCGFCGREFEEDRGQPACRSCPLGEACRFVRCPSCGFENPARPGWLDRLAALLGARGSEPPKNGGRRGGS